MVTALAIFGGVVLTLFIAFMFFRSRAILRANRIMENTIRVYWSTMGTDDPDAQDDAALQMMRDACLSARTLNHYHLALGAVRALSPDIVKNKQKLEEFKRELILFGQMHGWTNF
jgi:uncharacterized protein YneF (UPF0154 family)